MRDLEVPVGVVYQLRLDLFPDLFPEILRVLAVERNECV
jgi:hypothetical protein